MIKEQFLQSEKDNRKRVSEDSNRLAYHLMAPVGWLNDPNGLCQMNGIHHIFYQYAPTAPSGNGLKGWGHYSTKDYVHFIEEEISLFPDSEMDDGGAYSGSAFIDPKNELIHFFYTGNGKYPGDYDYINEGRKHWVNHFTSEDGFNFSDKETLMKNKDYPSNLSCHVRDPKVLEKDGHYYMVLGSRTRDSKGQVSVFKSDDLIHWTFASTIQPESKFGYMWECPDLFELDNKMVLITCPQGIPQQGLRYENIYQNGYFFVDPNLDSDQLVNNFTELDHGFDFYASQSYEDEKGRRILIPWMGIPDADYDNDPTVKKGWQHALGLPRELRLESGRLIQYPIEETLNLRIEDSKKSFVLKAGEIEKLPGSVCEIQVETHNQKPFWIRLRHDVSISYDGTVVTLDMGKSGQGRDQRHVYMDELSSISIFSDTSSLEIFLDHGKEAFTTRVYDDQKNLKIESNIDLDVEVYELQSFIIEKNH
ncbi:glycoside hydrolase family 32 protein [Ileibacterium valens]|uniref:glycoside hydrolase family 32 protein n=1 Tax=Ileibacterium valens TaxID=1862668 RepID=UPI00259B8DB6|nr:glycoside hydrolase family 32 protein [Ileibacterium valens]